MSDNENESDTSTDELPESAEAERAREESPEKGPVPERPSDKAPEAGKGEGRKHATQRPPEDQRTRPDPNQKEP